MTQIRLFLKIYVQPFRAFGAVIDEGRLMAALGLAVLAILVAQAPRQMHDQRLLDQAMRYVKAHPLPPRAATAPDPAPQEGSDDEDAADRFSALGPMPLFAAVDQFIGSAHFHYFPQLIALALCFVPAVILIVSLLEGLGHFTNVLFRDYLALAICTLFALAAAYLPFGIVNLALEYLKPAWFDLPYLWWGASACFLVLMIFAVRTLMGAGAWHGAAAVAGGWVAGVGGIWLHFFAGNVTWYLASPCVLYYLWANLQGSFYSIGRGLSSRQRMKRNLETLTINPHDADAHLQLGLIYLQRKQYETAAERFRKAVEIDPSEPDAHFQLGRIARLEGRYAEALEQCQTAARLDDKHSGSEVWRELGVVQFHSGRLEAARFALEKFIARREYDPEGQCWYGRVLKALGDREGARRAFQSAIEAAKTMPAPRKYQVRSWASDATQELRGLDAPAGRPAQAGISRSRGSQVPATNTQE